jgi:hypothetical protein
MASKKPAATKTVRSAFRAAKTEAATAPPAKVWTLPILLLMACVAAGGLWLAVRESSNAPQAAESTMAPDAGHETAAPGEAGKHTGGVARAASPATAAPTETARAAAVRPSSISGCLQRSDSGFMLKNTEGSEAPRSRSWKSGFLKRSTSSVSLSDPASAAHLSSYVGQRVSVTGSLVDRQMQVQSLRRLSATCE